MVEVLLFVMLVGVLMYYVGKSDTIMLFIALPQLKTLVYVRHYVEIAKYNLIILPLYAAH